MSSQKEPRGMVYYVKFASNNIVTSVVFSTLTIHLTFQFALSQMKISLFPPALKIS